MTDGQQVAVVGGGFMGSGIAQVSAAAGLSVVVQDIQGGALAATQTRIEASLARSVRAGRATQAAAAQTLERIRFTQDLSELGDAALVIEAVPEDLELKRQVLAEVARLVSPDALIASNTSSIPIAQLAAAVPGGERVLGLHFFSPVPMMELVEVVVALDTSDQTVAAGRRFVERLGKKPIETKDRSGFIVNALLVPYLMAAVRMYEEGFATREDIDSGMKLGCGHPMGPLTLCDFIGIDVLYSVCNELYDEFKRPEYAPPPLLKRMVAAGRHGRKAGRGFYEYDQATAPVSS